MIPRMHVWFDFEEIPSGYTTIIVELERARAYLHVRGDGSFFVLEERPRDADEGSLCGWKELR